MLEHGDRVKLTKQQSNKTFHGTEPPPGYWIEGVVDTFRVGARLTVDREIRNGIEVPGYFQTSFVESIESVNDKTFILKTENSTWVAEILG